MWGTDLNTHLERYGITMPYEPGAIVPGCTLCPECDSNVPSIDLIHVDTWCEHKCWNCNAEFLVKKVVTIKYISKRPDE